MRPLLLTALLSAVSLPLGCGGESDPGATQSPTVTDITLTSVDPAVVLPGSTLVLGGAYFIPSFAGATTLHLSGQLDGAEVEVSLPAIFVDYDRMEVAWPGGLEVGLAAAAGLFSGEASLSASSSLDGQRHRSSPLPFDLEVRTELSPRLDTLQNEVLFVNDPVVAHGDGFLLGGDEGYTVAVVEGCFTPDGAGSCDPVGPTEVTASPAAPFDRTRAVFPFSPYIAGIQPGSFSGTVYLLNRPGPLAGGVEQSSTSLPTGNELIEPAINSVYPAVASLGQYVDLGGGGFVGPSPGESPGFAFTLIELDGTFTPEGGSPTPTSLTLVPEPVSGQLVRYVVNEEDELGQAVDLRHDAGQFVGTLRPSVTFGTDTVLGSSTPVNLGVGHVKQVVWLRFLPTYRESLHHFGLKGADSQIRDRVVEVVRRDYAGVNLEVRSERPDDFALYAEVEIGGPDPNGIGLLGYDNTPGKDDGNLRLYDKIGGVNAVTQADGYPGYGGVFVESLFVFSQHPGSFAQAGGPGDPVFDQIFDPFRPDRGGTAVGEAELDGVSWLVESSSCPANDRPTRIACAVWALGGLVGTTVSHEVAHSLGLADPGGGALHNTGDWPNALMDAGSERSFLERAELLGQGPGAFCAHNYDYLRQVLPTPDPDPLPMREECW